MAPIVIVDSTAKAAVCREYFGGEAEVFLLDNELLTAVHKSVNRVENKQEFELSVLDAGHEIISALRRATDEEIYIIFDFDADADYRAWLLAVCCRQQSGRRKPLTRLYPVGMTPLEIDDALQQIRVVEVESGVNAYIRRLFDVRLRTHLRRLLGTSRGPADLPLNLISLTTIFSLADREDEIKAFEPVPKWQIIADLRLEGRIFSVRLEEAFDVTSDGSFPEESDAGKLALSLRQDKFLVENVKRQELVIPPPAPYQLPELLHDARVLHQLNPVDTLAILGRLYDGVMLDGKVQGLISSPLAGGDEESLANSLRRFAEQAATLFDEGEIGNAAAIEPTAGLIYPLRPALEDRQLAEELTENERRIYDMLRRRALASLLRPALGENIRIEIAGGPETMFALTLPSITRSGFLDIWQGRIAGGFLEPCPLAAIEAGADARLLDLRVEKMGGISAEPYTIESLLVDLADFSIVAQRPALEILQAMLESGYIDCAANGFLRPTAVCCQVDAILKRAFPQMQGVNLSAYIEQTISEVTGGRKDLDFALKQFEQTLMMYGKGLVKRKLTVKVRPRKRTSTRIIKQSSLKAEVVEKAAGRPEILLSEVVEPEAEEIVSPDPSMEESGTVDLLESGVESVDGEENIKTDDMPGAVAGEEENLTAGVVLAGDGGEKEPVTDSWSAELSNILEGALEKGGDDGREISREPPVSELIATEQSKNCPVCGASMLLKKDSFGKFWSCAAFPACRHTENYSEAAALDILCPLCGTARLLEQRTPAGKSFYVCPAADCGFMAWSRPHDVPCQVCGSPYLVEKKGAGGRLTLRCPRAECDYTVPLSGGENLSSPPVYKKNKKKLRVRRVAKGSARKRVRVVHRKK
ncbi:DNA topoisomerase [Desulfobacterota bacterium M19]